MSKRLNDQLYVLVGACIEGLSHQEKQGIANKLEQMAADWIDLPKTQRRSFLENISDQTTREIAQLLFVKHALGQKGKKATMSAAFTKVPSSKA